MTITLDRFMTGRHGTLGKLILDNSTAPLYTLERSWQDNAKGVSCIPRGAYIMRRRNSPSKGDCFRLDPEQVKPRSEILLHVGNFAADDRLGLKCDSLGCILPGVGVGWLDHQLAVTNSRAAMDYLLRRYGEESLTHLVIQGVCG